MIGARVSGSSPSRGHNVVFLCKTLYSQARSVSLRTVVYLGTGEFMLRLILRQTSTSSRGSRNTPSLFNSWTNSGPMGYVVWRRSNGSQEIGHESETICEVAYLLK